VNANRNSSFLSERNVSPDVMAWVYPIASGTVQRWPIASEYILKGAWWTLKNSYSSAIGYTSVDRPSPSAGKVREVGVPRVLV
jgi:hypothetical protein